MVCVEPWHRGPLHFSLSHTHKRWFQLLSYSLLSPFRYGFHSMKTVLVEVISDLHVAKHNSQLSVLTLLNLPESLPRLISPCSLRASFDSQDTVALPLFLLPHWILSFPLLVLLLELLTLGCPMV